MKKKLMILLASLMLVGCSNEGVVNETAPEYFTTISDELYGSVVYDSRTGVQYWMSDSTYNRGNLTMLCDADGKPLIYKGVQK